MADLKISQLTSATLPLAGTEVLPIVQSSSTKKVATDDLTVKNVRSNATTGILQIAGPSAAATRTMTVPDANFTAARIDAAQSFTGDQTLSTGNVVIGTSGKGIDFSATPGTGTSELLADYEEGTWTPADASGAGLTITQNNTALYVKVGNEVTCSMDITFPATADPSIARISLPFTTATGASFCGSLGYQDLTTLVLPTAASNAANFVFWDLTPAVKTNANLSGKRFIISFAYRSA